MDYLSPQDIFMGILVTPAIHSSQLIHHIRPVLPSVTLNLLYFSRSLAEADFKKGDSRKYRRDEIASSAVHTSELWINDSESYQEVE